MQLSVEFTWVWRLMGEGMRCLYGGRAVWTSMHASSGVHCPDIGNALFASGTAQNDTRPRVCVSRNISARWAKRYGGTDGQWHAFGDTSSKATDLRLYLCSTQILVRQKWILSYYKPTMAILPSICTPVHTFIHLPGHRATSHVSSASAADL